MAARSLIFVLTSLLLTACGREEVPPPPIPYETLSDILAEVLIIEPAGREFAYTAQDSLYDHYYHLVLARRGYTQDDFIATLRQLQQDPKALEAVYTEVLERIQIIETEANK